MSAQPIRFGGQMTSSGFRFELSGGHVALDFANTLDERLGNPPRELLTGYSDLLRWSRQSGLLDPSPARALARAGRDDPAAAVRAFVRALGLRETIFRLCHGFAESGVLADRELRAIESALQSALRHRRLEASRSGVRWTWDDLDPAAIVWRVADAAVSLLTSGRLDRVRVCDGSNCLWLFLDTSRKGNRRWCDMSVCGNRAKARRHYQRDREAALRS